MTEVFLDTAYALALADKSDMHHGRALALADELERSKTKIVTTRPVMLEIGNAMSRAGFRSAAVQLLNSLERDPQVDRVPLSEELYFDAFGLFSSRPDKSWGLVDCVSFVVMTQRGLTSALTTDLHFEQAGFRALMVHKSS